ncbi:MAG: beta-lactamase family protein [Lacticaseibacillus songhuajiangensis]|jgi:CubicO group peptidase (beta-lactamase class C family)|nr:beta-lactamase family protein [Lacticaseibacillus songhuajiangensis]
MQQHLRDIYSGIDKQMYHLVSSGVTPGVSYALIDGNNVVTQYIGDRQELPQRTPLTAGLYYDLASLTKVVGTTPLFMRALNEGKLRLDDHLIDYLPDFSVPSITFRELMTHTSGLEGFIPHRDELSAPELQRALTTQLHRGTDEGQQVVYRDFNLLLTGWALEKIYGAPVQELIAKMVLEPFGLTRDCTFTPEATLCVGTTYTATGGLRQGLVHDPKAAILREHSAAAGMFATLTGLVKYVQVLSDVRAQTVLPGGWAQQLQRNYNGGRSIGFDLRYGYSGEAWLYHTGYTGTFMVFNPRTQQGLVVLADRVHPYVHPEFLHLRDQIVPQYLQLAENA